MASVTVKQSGKKISCKEGDNLLKVLLAEGIFVDNPCNGKGICGKCKVRILSGQVSAASETEMDQLSAGEREQGIRLSCMAEVLGDVEVELLKKDYAKEVTLLKIELPNVEKIPFVRFDEAKRLIAEKYDRQIRSPHDLEPEEEALIGEYFKSEYGADFVFVTHYPSKKRPFYAMDDPGKNDP